MNIHEQARAIIDDFAEIARQDRFGYDSGPFRAAAAERLASILDGLRAVQVIPKTDPVEWAKTMRGPGGLVPPTPEQLDEMLSQPCQLLSKVGDYPETGGLRGSEPTEPPAEVRRGPGRPKKG
jgi:hypothetical protein